RVVSNAKISLPSRLPVAAQETAPNPPTPPTTCSSL
uniref:Uncharacterized protein n=1 Tax=Aegilops tauschii subsp. strangulata TaxID=200361 RepID=A0A452ZT75_AEGTS